MPASFIGVPYGPPGIYINKKLNNSVFDVASYILEKLNKASTLKLQRLLYYCQAWSLVWEKNPIFKEKILAWYGGPIIKEIWDVSLDDNGILKEAISTIEQGDSFKLNQIDKNVIDDVLKFYGDWTSLQLSEQALNEKPWKLARNDLPISERGNRGNVEILHNYLIDYYGNINMANSILENTIGI